MPGFPIRTSADQRSIDNSPRLNAALHVLHRPSMPRHPPCALNNEHTTNTTTTTKWQSNCAGVNTQNTKEQRNHTNHDPPPTQKKMESTWLNARVHYTVLTQHPTQDNNHTTKKAVIETYMGYTTREQCPRHPTMHQALINTQLDVHVLVESSFWLRCISTRLSFGSSKTIVYSTTKRVRINTHTLYSTNWCSIKAP